MIEQGVVHGGKMQRRGAAATADNARATITRQSSIFSHQFRCPRILNLAIDKLRDAAIGLGDEKVLVLGMGPHRQQCPPQIGRADAAVGAKGC